MSKTSWAAAAVLAGLTVAGVWAASARFGASSTPSEPPDFSADHRSVRLLREPVEMPAFSITDLSGKTISSEEWRGKVILVNFWATWCNPCRIEIPALIQLQDKYRDHLVVIGISQDEGPVEDVKRFVADQRINYPVAMTTPELQKLFKGIVALPTTFVLDQKGRMQQRHVGLLDMSNTETETRVIAGLKTNASVELIENAEKMRLERASQAKALPGIDMAHLNDVQKSEVVKSLIEMECSCGCGLTVAECRIDDPKCETSLGMAKDAVKKYSETVAANGT